MLSANSGIHSRSAEAVLVVNSMQLARDAESDDPLQLAAAQGNAFAEMFLKDTAGKMTREQIAQAEELAREWNPTTQLPR